MDESFDVNVIARGRCGAHIHTTPTTVRAPRRFSARFKLQYIIRVSYIFEEEEEEEKEEERVLGISSRKLLDIFRRRGNRGW